jgi:hypothetical protein
LPLRSWAAIPNSAGSGGDAGRGQEEVFQQALPVGSKALQGNPASAGTGTAVGGNIRGDPGSNCRRGCPRAATPEMEVGTRPCLPIGDLAQQARPRELVLGRDNMQYWPTQVDHSRCAGVPHENAVPPRAAAIWRSRQERNREQEVRGQGEADQEKGVCSLTHLGVQAPPEAGSVSEPRRQVAAAVAVSVVQQGEERVRISGRWLTYICSVHRIYTTCAGCEDEHTTTTGRGRGNQVGQETGG